jgi:15-cis-phytoene synthase
MALYRQALDACYAERGAALDNPELAALAASIRRFKIPRQPFEDLILGLEMDLAGTRYQTFEDLSVYCYRVASTIGLIAIEIFGYTDLRARDYAVNLGKALQLVNILRDIQSDARRGRIYLPSADLEQFGVRPDDLLSGVYQDAFIRLMGFESDRARRFFAEARRFLPPQDRRRMVSAEIMAAIYWRLLARIRERRYNVFRERVRVPTHEKLWTALSVYLGAEWFN